MKQYLSLACNSPSRKGWQASEPLGSAISAFPAPRLQLNITTSGFFMWGIKIQTKVLVSAGQALCQPSHLPARLLLLFHHSSTVSRNEYDSQKCFWNSIALGSYEDGCVCHVKINWSLECLRKLIIIECLSCTRKYAMNFCLYYVIESSVPNSQLNIDFISMVWNVACVVYAWNKVL